MIQPCWVVVHPHPFATRGHRGGRVFPHLDLAQAMDYARDHGFEVLKGWADPRTAGFAMAYKRNRQRKG
jgi:hypothetical protein